MEDDECLLLLFFAMMSIMCYILNDIDTCLTRMLFFDAFQVVSEVLIGPSEEVSHIGDEPRKMDNQCYIFIG